MLYESTSHLWKWQIELYFISRRHEIRVPPSSNIMFFTTYVIFLYRLVLCKYNIQSCWHFCYYIGDCMKFFIYKKKIQKNHGNPLCYSLCRFWYFKRLIPAHFPGIVWTKGGQFGESLLYVPSKYSIKIYFIIFFLYLKTTSKSNNPHHK